jgi:hypothetical protein
VRLGKFPMLPRTLFCRRCNFNRWESAANYRFAEMSGYIRNRRERKDSKSVHIGSAVGQNEPPVPIGCQTQPSEPIGDKSRIYIVALKRAVCAGLETDVGEAEGCAPVNHTLQNRPTCRNGSSSFLIEFFRTICQLLQANTMISF